jgi:dTDP-4-amino-4,6-dideoxygalactose transaminase
MDPADVRRKITKRTKAIIPVHYAGQSCDMDEINKLAERHGLCIVEDAAHAFGAKYKGKYCGNLGDIGCFSFHGTKNLVSGEGGAFVTNDRSLARRAEIMREKGTNRDAFMRKQIRKYEWISIGSSFVLSDILAAVLIEQLKKTDQIIMKRARIWKYYQNKLASLEASGKIKLLKLGKDVASNFHIFAFTVDQNIRDSVITEYRKRGVGAAFHYVPLHTSPYGRKHLGYSHGSLHVTERVASSLVRLPIYPSLGASDQERVMEASYEILDR